MSGRHKPRRPGRVVLNTMAVATAGARCLSDTDVQRQMAIMDQALAEFCRGQNCVLHWASLADGANMAETLASMGLGGGADAEHVVEAAQAALAEVRGRQQVRGTWTLYADEIDALGWLLRLFAVQLAACSYTEFERAYRRTQQRLAQALAGNAAPGVVVVHGLVGAAA